jgi:hypothetical protein
MWLRSDKRELRNRNQPKTKFLNAHRKKRKRARNNQYCKTLKLMKNEKQQASVLASSQYSTDDLTLYNDKVSLNAKKVVTAKKIFNTKTNNINIENLSPFTSDSVAQYGTIAYDLNNIEIDLDIHTNAIASNVVEENEQVLNYGSTSEHFQTLNTQYEDFGCDYTKNSTEITVSDILLKRKFNRKTFPLNFPPIKLLFTLLL